jgi:integrase
MSNKIKFTDRWLQSLKPLSSRDPGYRKALWDASMPGLCIRPGHTITFYVGKRPKGSKQFVWSKLGDYPVLSLAEARSRAAIAVASIGEGKAAPQHTTPGLMTFADAAAQFMRDCLDGKRTRTEIEQLFYGKLISAFGGKLLTAITHDEIVAALREIADRPERHDRGRSVSGGPHAARKALTHLHVMLRWAAFNRIGGLTVDPSAAIPAIELLRGRQFNRQRDRTLDDRELRAIWQRAEEIGYPFGTLVQALILTGQRLGELANARWCEVAGDTLLIPPERMKNKRAHALPLTPRLQEVVGSLPRAEGGEFLFSTTGGRRPISGFSKYKVKFDRGLDIVPWQLHDLRRTVRTGLSRAGVPVFDAELIIAHQQSGVHGVYDKFRYQEEKLNGLSKWEELLARILDPRATSSSCKKPIENTPYERLGIL